MVGLMEVGIAATMGALATIAGAFEDAESDVGSQSNPNSQVQLAPQMMNFHRYFNKAISGEPVSYMMYGAIAGTIAWVFMTKFGLPFLAAVAIGVGINAAVHMIFATTSHLGRMASSAEFGHPIYLDVVVSHLGPIAGFGAIATFCIVSLAYIQWSILKHPFPMPLLAALWGVTVGAIGSSTGDVHYGAERLYQHYPFGCGVPVAAHGNITRKAETGIRNSMDSVFFCAKFGNPATGLCFGLIIFFSTWAGLFGPWGGVIAMALVTLAALIISNRIEKKARKEYGTYEDVSVDEICDPI